MSQVPRRRRRRIYIPAENGARRRDTSKAFMRVLDKAGIKNFTWHCLRHDFASQLAMKGVPMHVIQKLIL